MSDSHLSALASKHAGLEGRIADEQRRPQPDDGLVTALKREKLRIKEEMEGR